MAYVISRTNAERRAQAAEALDCFAKQAGDELASDEERLTDLLADLLHWCTAEEVHFDKCLRMARGHFEAERDGD